MQEETKPRALPRFIGISGKMGAGKDTVAGLIEQCTYMRTDIQRFAGSLKKIVAEMTGTEEAENYSTEGKKTVPPGFTQSLAKLQQIVGTLMRKEINDDVWILSLMNRCHGAHTIYVVPDVRFPNEVKALQEAGGVVIKLVRGGDAPREDGRDTRHISETALDDFDGWDYVIDNTHDTYDEASLKVLERRVREVLCDLGVIGPDELSD